MLTCKQYEYELNLEMDMYKELMQQAWGEVPILEPKVEVVLKVSMDFDLGDFPHKGQSFIVEPSKENKLTPVKVAKAIVQEINSHRNHCDRCGVPVPHVWSRQHGASEYLKSGEARNWRTGTTFTWAEIEAYDLPPDVLERYIHPVLSRRIEKRLVAKKEAEKNSPEAYNKEMDEWFGNGYA